MTSRSLLVRGRLTIGVAAAAVLVGACAPAHPAPAATKPLPTGCASAPASDSARNAGPPLFEFQTARPAQVLDDGFRPRRGAVAGEILVQFIVDPAGLVEPGTLRVLNDGDARLAAQVRALLPELRFAPAEVPLGCPVRQLVQHPFRFH
jgi:hypothetical protein